MWELSFDEVEMSREPNPHCPPSGSHVTHSDDLSQESPHAIDLTPLFGSRVTESGSFDLRRMEENAFETLLQALSVPTLLVAPSDVVEFANNAFIRLSGHPGPTGLKFSALFPNEEEAQAHSLLTEAVAARTCVERETKLNVGQKTLWSRIHLQPIRLGEELAVLVQVENLTAERELATTKKYTKLMNMFPIGIAEFATEGPLPRDLPADLLGESVLQSRIVDGNHEFARMHGLGAADTLVGITLSKLLPAEGKGRNFLMEWIRSGFPTSTFERKEKCWNEPAKNFENTLIVNVNEQDIRGLWWLKRDISEKKRIDSELLKGQKLESLGVLAGGIAHDFNNLLTGILGNISLGLMHWNQKEKSMERFQAAARAANRAQDLTHQLLTFAKGGAPIKKTGSLAELLKDCTEFVLMGSKVRCKCSIPKDLWAVEMDDGQISQVINNLLLNAVESMPNGGAILVRATNFAVRGGE
jgi:two-component system, cell cycle sensor histidine kinase and response regulator CckA